MNTVKKFGYIKYPNSDKKHQSGLIIDITGLCPTLMARTQGDSARIALGGYMNNLRIRKLTPKECWRLMSFTDDEFKKAEKVNSNTQLYKQAGNSIVVNVLVAIIKNLHLENEEIKLLELFGGIGACSRAMDRLKLNYKIIDYVEIDKYACKSYNEINETSFQPQDISTWDKDVDVNFIMHGSPCQDFSLAGLQKGGDEGSGTRSSLMYETIRIVEKLRPKYVVWENVKNLLSKKHRHNFDAYLKKMESLGYTNYYQVLNAKDYGVPQNRERVFTISILNGNEYKFPKGDENKNKIIEHNSNAKHQQDLIQDENGLCRCIPAGTHGSTPHLLKTVIGYNFPDKKELKLKLKDILEENVDEKYYLSDKMITYISADNEKWTGNNDKALINKDIASTINTGEGSRRWDASNYVSDDMPENYNLKVTRKYGIFDDEKSKHQAGSVYDKDGLSPTLDTMQGGWRQPMIEEDLSYVGKKYNEFISEKGYIPNKFNPYNKTEIKDVAPTQTTQCGSTASSATVLIVEDNRFSDLD